MSGTLVHHKGRNGEETPLTYAQRSNQGIWEHEAKALRARKYQRYMALAFLVCTTTAITIWQFIL